MSQDKTRLTKNNLVQEYLYLYRDVLSCFESLCPLSISGLSHVQTYPVQQNAARDTTCIAGLY